MTTGAGVLKLTNQRGKIKDGLATILIVCGVGVDD
jgi:hypothetical protein